MAVAVRVPPGRGGAAHQFVIAPEPDLRNIAVTCTCLRSAERGPLGVQPRWAGGEAYAAWLGHIEAEAGPEAAL
jgi:hypothetical protein